MNFELRDFGFFEGRFQALKSAILNSKSEILL
jgi:hypothetical protein